MTDLIEKNEFNGRRLSVFKSNLMLPRHRWYEFKEGFSSELVAEAINQTCSHSQKLRILDPFAGSGTTLVAAGQKNHYAYGIEVNPFLAFASMAKCAGDPWDPISFSKAINRAISSGLIEQFSPVENLSTFSEREGLTKWLFNTSVLRGYSSIDQAIEGLDDYKTVLKLALLGSLMDCCNAKRDGKCLRYKNNWQSNGFNSASLQDAFVKRTKQIEYDIQSYPFYSQNISVAQGDSRKTLKELESNSFDLVVTSPPYLNSFDYSDVYRPELFVGGFVKTNDELKRIRLKTIRSHVQANWVSSNEITSALLIPIIDGLLQKQLWNKHIIEMVTSYFSDMSSILLSLYRVVKNKGSVWIVVSTSAYGGIEIPVDLIFADIAVKFGWKLQGIYVLRNLRSAGQQWGSLDTPRKKPLRESLLILKK